MSLRMELKPMSEQPTLQRNYATAIELSLDTPVGKAVLTVDLAPIRRPNLDKAGELKFACSDPSHKTPTGVLQLYRCCDGHEHREHELGRMRVVDDETVVAITTDEATAVRCGPIEKGVMTLSVHPAADVEATTTADASAYRCRLGKKASANQAESYATMVALASDPKLAIVGTLRLRDSRNCFRVVVHRGQLTLVSLVLPQDLEPADEFALPTVDAKRLKVAKAALEQMVTPFDPDAFYHNVATAMDELVATKTPNAPALVAVASAPTEGNDILAAMEKMLTAKKVVKPRTPRKTAAAKRTSRTPAKRKAG